MAKISLPGGLAWPRFFYATVASTGFSNDQNHIVCNFLQNALHVIGEIFCSAEVIV